MNEANVLFIDSPVGSGYSYVDKLSQLTTDVNQITHDLHQLVKQFMIRYPQFKVVIIRIYQFIIMLSLYVVKAELHPEKAKMGYYAHCYALFLSQILCSTFRARIMTKKRIVVAKMADRTAYDVVRYS